MNPFRAQPFARGVSQCRAAADNALRRYFGIALRHPIHDRRAIVTVQPGQQDGRLFPVRSLPPVFGRPDVISYKLSDFHTYFEVHTASGEIFLQKLMGKTNLLANV